MVELTRELWSQAWPEAQALAAMHVAEVGDQPLNLDEELMLELENAEVLFCWAARQQGQMVGYMTWTVGYDPEHKTRLEAKQGAWFVLPGFARAALQLFETSVDWLRMQGVQELMLHHRTQGRGATLGKFFQRRGAQPYEISYLLKLEA